MNKARNTSEDTYLFIVNLKAGNRKNRKKFLNKLRKIEKQNSDKVKVVITKYSGHATKIAEEHLTSHYSVFVAVGGDGTANEVGSIIVNTNKVLAVIPKGSGNGFSHQINSGKRAKEILKAIMNQSYTTREIDTASLNNHPFLNIAGIGFDAHISKLIDKSEVRGLLTYLNLIFRQLFVYKCENYFIETDREQYEGKYFMVAFANSPEYGNHFTISPESDLSDGILEICVANRPRLKNILSFILSLILKKRRWSEQLINCKSFEKCSIKVNDAMPVHVDGNFLGQEKSCNIEVNKLSLSVLVAN